MKFPQTAKVCTFIEIIHDKQKRIALKSLIKYADLAF